jgi:NMD protein affecting ribosome stability and mRNA decay
METDKKHYHFINTQTGNTIAHFTVSIEISDIELKELLETKKKALAVENKIFVDTIYWEIAR